MNTQFFTRIGTAMVVMAVLLAAGCAPDDSGNGGEPPPVDSVTLNRPTLTLVSGNSASLAATVYPENAADKTVTWVSDNVAVAEVTPNATDGNRATVTAKSAGTAKITVTTTDGGKEAYCNVTVTPATSSKPADPAEIEAYIDANWQEYGYDERPTKYMALSFDDGPNAGVTQSLLNALEAEKVKATFFSIGQNIRNNKELAQATFNAGHELGNHSDAYAALGGATVAAITTSLTAANTAIKEITEEDPILFRAPNVAYGPNLTQVCTELGLAIIGVSVWSSDWEGISTENIIANVLARAQDGGIINCHELAATVAAIPDMIAGLREQGYWIMTVSELAIIKGKTLEAGIQYDSIK